MQNQEHVYMSISEPGKDWSETNQKYLGFMVWPEAVEVAKQQHSATRLCNSPGYNNQGHYFQPSEKQTS